MREIGATLQQLAEAFVGRVRGEREIALEILLNRSALDYSLASLEVVDRYLDDVHESVRPARGWRGWFASKDIERSPELDKTIVRGGAYVGEVLRRAQPAWSWMDYDDFVLQDENAAKILGPRGIGTTALLVKANGSLTLPVNKVLRYLLEGSEHSTRHYVGSFM